MRKKSIQMLQRGEGLRGRWCVHTSGALSERCADDVGQEREVRNPCLHGRTGSRCAAAPGAFRKWGFLLCKYSSRD